MLSHDELIALYRKLKDESVLTVYIDGSARDPAERTAWRRQMEVELSAARNRLAEEDPDHLDPFDRAATGVRSALADYDGFLPHEGWVGWSTPTGLEHSEGLSLPLPHWVQWGQGMRVAPYLRGLKMGRPIVACLLDSRRARVFRSLEGVLEEIEDERALHHIDDLSDGARKSASTSSGTRGQTRTDAAQKMLQVETDRLLRRLLDIVVREAGKDGSVLVGGPPEMARALLAGLPDPLKPRTAEVSDLHVDMSHAEIRARLREAASALSDRRSAELLEAISNDAHAQGRACLGWDRTLDALGKHAVDTLLLSRTAVRENRNHVDEAARLALLQGGRIVEVGGPADTRLMEIGEGVAARLRFQPGPS